MVNTSRKISSFRIYENYHHCSNFPQQYFKVSESPFYDFGTCMETTFLTLVRLLAFNISSSAKLFFSKKQF